MLRSRLRMLRVLAVVGVLLHGGHDRSARADSVLADEPLESSFQMSPDSAQTSVWAQGREREHDHCSPVDEDSDATVRLTQYVRCAAEQRVSLLDIFRVLFVMRRTGDPSCATRDRLTCIGNPDAERRIRGAIARAHLNVSDSSLTSLFNILCGTTSGPRVCVPGLPASPTSAAIDRRRGNVGGLDHAVSAEDVRQILEVIEQRELHRHTEAPNKIVLEPQDLVNVVWKVLSLESFVIGAPGGPSVLSPGVARAVSPVVSLQIVDSDGGLHHACTATVFERAYASNLHGGENGSDPQGLPSLRLRILTAAHCLLGPTEQYRVVLGAPTIIGHDDDSEFSLRVLNVEVSSDFVQGRVQGDLGTAWLEAVEPGTLAYGLAEDMTLPKLAIREQHLDLVDRIHFAGFGAHEDGTVSPTVRVGSAKLANDLCTQHYRDFPVNSSGGGARLFCTGPAPVPSPCGADSGGPAFVLPNEYLLADPKCSGASIEETGGRTQACLGQMTIVGIIAAGRCGARGYHLYTYLPGFLEGQTALPSRPPKSP